MTASAMFSVYSRALGVLLALLVLAACGGSDEGGPERVSEEGGLATYEVEEYGFSVGVPSDWRAVSAQAAFDRRDGRVDEGGRS